MNKLMAKYMQKKAEGFTLVEILVVILIIGLLFVFLVPKISSSTDKAREVGLKTDFHSYETAFESVMKEKGGLGTNAVAAADLVTSINEYLDPALKIGACTTAGTAVDTAKKDPWNNPYKFYFVQGTGSTNNGAVAVYSTGKDSAEDTSGVNDLAATDVATGGTASTFQGAVNGCVEVSTEDGHDYIMACAFIDGVEYTATAGFSTNIEAGEAATPTPDAP